MLQRESINASDFVADALKGAFISSKLGNYSQLVDSLEQPPPWETWGVGLAVVAACSFSPPLGMLMLPCLSPSIQDRIMTFLIALGIGALSGSCFFVMIPQAFQLTTLEQIDYISKAWIMICALYTFLTVDRLLQYALEFRRRRQAKHKVHASTLKRILGSVMGIGKERQTTEQTDVEEAERERRDRDELKNELEINMLNNALARTFSTRRRVAVVRAVEGIEYHGADDRGPSRPLSPCHPRRPFHAPKAFLDEVNGEMDKQVYPVIPRIIDPVERTITPPTVYYTNGKDRKKKEEDDEMSVSVQVIEKHVVDPKQVEIASVAYMIIFGSSANNFVDGMSMGAAFADSLLRGLSIGLAVLSQQFPQELGTLAILSNSGLGMRRALLFNLIPILLSFVGFSVGVFLDEVDESYDTYIFAISSGMYLYIFLGTLIPEIRESVNEMIRTNLRESLLVTALQIAGIGLGISLIFFMGQFGDAVLE